MWTCPPCGTTNETHRIFCSACGAMKSKSLVPESHAPAAAGSPSADPPSGPELTQTAGQFALHWIGMNVAAAVLAWVVTMGLHRGVMSSIYQRSGESAARVVSFAISAGVYGILYGIFQARTLSNAVPGRGWSGWAIAKVVGFSLSGSVYLFFPTRTTIQEEFRVWALAAALLGLVGGGASGILQALTLFRKLGAPSWFVGWTLLSAGATALATLVGAAVSHAIRGQALASTGVYYGISLGQTAVMAAFYAVLTGIPLGRWLVKHPGLTRVEMPPI